MKLKIIIFISVVLVMLNLFLAFKYYMARNNCGGCIEGCSEVCSAPNVPCAFAEYSRQTIKSYLNSCDIHDLDRWL